MQTLYKKIFILIVIAAIPMLFYAVYRDSKLEKQYACDYRNRVVGARLIKDGQLPYFYKWKPEDGIRYYLPTNWDTLKVSSITATPFFHHLMYPLAEVEQSLSSKIWLVLEYLMMLLMAIMAISLARTQLQQIVVVIAALHFMFTESWMMHVSSGQLYLIIPLLALAFYWLIQKKENKLFAFLAGLVAISLILIRPNTILFFLPFLLYIHQYKKTYWSFFLIPVMLMCVFLITPKERKLWTEYKAAMEEQLKVHQNLDYTKQNNMPYPRLMQWEGINMYDVDKERKERPLNYISENGNFFVALEFVFHKRPSVQLLNILSVLCIASFAFLFFFYHKKKESIKIEQLTIAAYIIYMFSDLFSPFYRHQYYTIQWLFPVLMFAIVYESRYKWFAVLFSIGLVLNIFTLQCFPMRHTIGEYLILLTSIAFVFYPMSIKKAPTLS